MKNPIFNNILALALMVLSAGVLIVLFPHSVLVSYVINILIFVLNSAFLYETYNFLSRQHNNRGVYAELGYVALLAFLNILAFAYLFYTSGLQFSGKLILHDFEASIYFSIVTWTTLGYGDFSPPASIRLYAALEAFLGYIYTAVIIGLFINVSKVDLNPN